MTEPVIASESDLDEGAMYRPLLISNEDGEHYLRSEITRETRGESIKYEIHMVDANDETLALSEKSALYIPYPEGMDMQSAAKYNVTIHHEAATGVEVFSTQDGTIELTPYGFCISVSSLSPFELSYLAPQTAIPDTGDRTPFELYGLLLGLSLAFCLLMTRKFQRE